MPRKRAESLVDEWVGCFTRESRFKTKSPLKTILGAFTAVCKKFINVVVSDEADTEIREHDILVLLSETQKTARIFLDAMQKSVNLQMTENVDIPENDSLLKEIGVI